MPGDRDLSTEPVTDFCREPLREKCHSLDADELYRAYEEGPFAWYTGERCTPLKPNSQTWKVNISPSFFKTMLGDVYFIGKEDKVEECSPVFTIRGIFFDSRTKEYRLLVEVGTGIFTVDPVKHYWGTTYLYEVYWSQGPQ